MKEPKRFLRTIPQQKISTLILFSGFLLFTQIILQTLPTWAVSSPITPTPQLVSGPNCQGQATLRWDITSIMQQTNANRVFWELKKDQPFQNLEGREPVRLDGQGSSSVPTGQVTINLGNYGQLVNGTVYYFRVVAKRNLNDVARRSDPVQFTYNCIASTPTPPPQTGVTGRKLNVWVYEDGTFNNATKQGQWIQGATVRVAKNPTSQSTPPYNQTRTTGGDGKAVFDNVVPNGAYDVTVEKAGCSPGLQGVTKTVGIPNNVDAKQYRDLDCVAQAPTPAPPPAAVSDIPTKPLIYITKFELNGGAEEVMVNTNVSLDYEYTAGTPPTHYKAVECSAFNAPYIQWKLLPTSGKPTIKIPTPRRSTTCFQLKLQRPGFEIKSNIARDSILVTPPVAQQPGTGVRPVQPVTGGTAASSCPQSISAPSISGPLQGAECVQDGSNPGAWFRWLPVDGVGGRYPYNIHFHRIGVASCSEDGSDDNPPDCWMYDQYNSHSVTEHYFALEEGTQYRWRVRGVCTDRDGITVYGQWSQWNEFETRPKLEQLNLSSPGNGDTVTAPAGVANVPVNLEWEEPPCGPYNYQVQIFEAGENNPIRNVYVASDNSITQYMPKGKTYDWRVRVTGPADTTDYSDKWSFTAQ